MAPSDPQTTQTRRFDPAAYLTTDEHRMAYLEAALETKEVRFMLDACVVVARSIAVFLRNTHPGAGTACRTYPNDLARRSRLVMTRRR